MSSCSRFRESQASLDVSALGQLRALVSDRFVDGNPVDEPKHWYR